MDINNNLPIKTEKKKRGRKPTVKIEETTPKEVKEPLWVSVSEAAKLSGVGTKTIRRSIEHDAVKFKVINNRYLINLSSLIAYLYKTTKLKNKFKQYGIGQYVEKWKS